MQLCPLIYLLFILSFELQKQRWTVATETVWSTKLKIVTIWPCKKMFSDCWFESLNLGEVCYTAITNWYIDAGKGGQWEPEKIWLVLHWLWHGVVGRGSVGEVMLNVSWAKCSLGLRGKWWGNQGSEWLWPGQSHMAVLLVPVQRLSPCSSRQVNLLGKRALGPERAEFGFQLCHFWDVWSWATEFLSVP